MRIFKNILLWLSLVVFPVLLITTNIRVLANQICIYEHSVNKYDIADVTGIGNAELIRVYQHWIDYYNYRRDSPQLVVEKLNGERIDILSEKEIIHLQDVRGLLQLDYKLQMITFIIILSAAFIFIWFRDWIFIPKAIFWGNIIVMALSLGIALLSITNFDRLFLIFHQISFTNQFWVLDPSRDYLIMMYPSGFFYDIALFGFSLVIFESVVLAGLTFCLLKFRKPGNSLSNKD